MKLNLIIPLFAFTFVLHLAATAAVPLRWTVETSRAQPAQFEAYQGETLDLEATLQSYGKPLEASGIAALYWQTNGMGSAYWEASAAVNSNRMSAVWTPEMDVGAKVYNCFIGQPGTIYHAAFQLRLRPSPGATPNVLPLPVPVIDFARVRVLNPPWEGGGGGVNTNAVIDIIHKTVDGAARPLPPYLHALDFDDSYPDDAAEYYRQREVEDEGEVEQRNFNNSTVGLRASTSTKSFVCSAVRSGNFLSRNFDYPFDERAEFVVKMSAGKGRFASVGVANVGTNLTESFVTSGKPSRWYKSLPGATVDGINENGVVAEINVVDGDPQTSGWHTTGDLHPLAAVRWTLDHATNAQHAAEHLAANIRFPEGWQQNFHYMIADEQETWVVENGSAHMVGTFANVAVMTNFRLYPSRDTTGEGQERYEALMSGANITSQWWTLTYTADGYRASDLPGITGEALTQLFDYWASKPREQHRGETFRSSTSTSDFDSISWWQTVHTSIYDITNRVLRIAVQERDEWFTFALAKNGTDEAKVRELAGEVVAPVASTVSGLQSSVSTLTSSVSGLQSTKLDGPTDTTLTLSGKAADALKVKQALDAKRGMTDRSWGDQVITEWTLSDVTGGPFESGNRFYRCEAGDNPYDSGVTWTNRVGFIIHSTEGTYSAAYCFNYPDGSPEPGTGRWTELHQTGVNAYIYDPSATMTVTATVQQDAFALSSEVPAPYTPPSYLRVYDDVRQCWWRGKMVNGVINWEVE